ncbi:MAG: phosphodiesterase, partial [Candidatus Binatia bacterium]
GLTGLGDPKLGKPAIRSVVSRQQVYAGPYAAESPDLVVNCASGFRVSWRTTLGGVPQGIFEDNGRKWAADHIIDPHLVPGILFINQASPVERPHLVDLAPTILDALGVPRGAAMEGRSVLG